MSRKPIVGGNWKCNPDSIAKLDGLIANINACDTSKCDVYVCPSPLHVSYCAGKFTNGAAICPQNCNFKGCGAYTGEMAVEQMKDMGIEWVLIGHSERREYFKESEELLATKLKYILDAGMKCVFAIGEKLPEREKGMEATMAVCIAQMEQIKGLMDPEKVVIAYEPVWAIGTGVTATPAQAQETHAEIRKWIAANVSEDCAAKIRIQYGGSANAKNAPELSACPDIDGFLVGGASLKPEFADIVSAISSVKKYSAGTVCVCGAGNAAHVFIPYFSKNGYDVTVFADFGDEAERLQKGVDENGGILVHDRSNPKAIKEYKAKPTAISKDAKDAVPQADYIIVALPSFAIKNVLTGIKPHLKEGAIIYIMPGQGGPDYVAREVLGDELKAGKCTMAGIIPMPLNCRISDWGKRVELAALKASYDLATIPAKNAEAAAQGLRGLLKGKKVNVIGNYVGIALHASNPNLHPGRLYGLWGPDSQLGLYEEGKVYPENPLFYETWTDKSSDWCQKISDERCLVWKTICEKVPGTGTPEQVPDLRSYLAAIYAGQIVDDSTITGCTSTNDGFKGFRCPMKEVEGGFIPAFDNRYFTEDFPEGVAMYKGIADLAGVETPVMDEIFGFFQKFMGKEYIKDGKLAGADVDKTKSPQRFGVTTLEQLLAD